MFDSCIKQEDEGSRQGFCMYRHICGIYDRISHYRRIDLRTYQLIAEYSLQHISWDRSVRFGPFILSVPGPRSFLKLYCVVFAFPIEFVFMRKNKRLFFLILFDINRNEKKTANIFLVL